MSAWKAKRFWKEARVEAVADGFAILLDDRPVKTPAKAPLILPTRALGEAIAAEWDAQVEEIRPETMPYTRSANAAIDKVAVQHAEVADLLAAYGETDLICYRATDPQDLIARQAEAWDPLLDWTRDTFGAALVPASGVIPRDQDPDALARLRAEVHAFDPFRLAAFHDLVSISGSLVLGLAVARGRLDVETAWTLSRIDETWQEEQWGADEEAGELAVHKHDALVVAARIFSLLARD